jgi:hypothetical protein
MKALATKDEKIQSSIGHLLVWLQEAVQSFRTGADPILGLRGQLDGQSVVALNFFIENEEAR